MNNVEINISNVSKKFKDISALDNVSMRFETGKLYGIIDACGGGKYRICGRWPCYALC